MADYNERHLKYARLSMEDIRKTMPPEYAKVMIQARKELANLRVSNDKAIIALWEDAAVEVSKKIRKSNGLKKQHLRNVLLDILRELNKAYRDLMKTDLSEAIKLQYDFNRDIMWQITKSQPSVEKLISKAGLSHVYSGLADEAAKAFLARKTAGLTLSQRIWRNNQQAYSIILKLATTGDLSSYEMARALEKYLTKDASALTVGESKILMERFKGTLPKDIKYAAFRLARTEITNAFAQSTYSAGGKNPFYKGIEWRLSTAHRSSIQCACPGLVGFHAKGNEPDVPHPNCMCSQIPVLDEMKAATERAIRWVNDPSTDGDMERWYQNVYLKGA